MIKQYKYLAHSYLDYWRLYGGARALFTSPYFHVAVLITLGCSPVWLVSGGEKIWPEAAISILPNLMGFSIAGMAIFLALPNSKVMEAATEDGRADSYFAITVANFFHFILVQAIALLLGFIGKHYYSAPLSGFGVFFLIYAILSGLAMAMQLLHTARIINAVASMKDHRHRGDDPRTWM